MKMAETPKLDLKRDLSSYEASGFRAMEEEKRISLSDRINGLQYNGEKAHSFVVDLESFSHGVERDVPANSRITLQRSFSRKWSQKGGSEKKLSCGSTGLDKERGSTNVGSMGEKPVLVTMGTTDHPVSPQVHHQITVTTANIGATTPPPGSQMRVLKRNAFRRSPAAWALDPKRILVFFATLSSMGSILLLYFTLTMGKLGEDSDTLNR